MATVNNGNSRNTKCKDCGTLMTRREWDIHECPASKGVNPEDFATFAEYREAAEKAVVAWKIRSYQWSRS
jgi:hypothetical protein